MARALVKFLGLGFFISTVSTTLITGASSTGSYLLKLSADLGAETAERGESSFGIGTISWTLGTSGSDSLGGVCTLGSSGSGSFSSIAYSVITTRLGSGFGSSTSLVVGGTTTLTGSAFGASYCFGGSATTAFFVAVTGLVFIFFKSASLPFFFCLPSSFPLFFFLSYSLSKSACSCC